MAVSHSKRAGLIVKAIAVLSAVVLPAGFLLAEQGSDGSTQNSVSDRPAVFTLHVPPGLASASMARTPIRRGSRGVS